MLGSPRWPSKFILWTIRSYTINMVVPSHALRTRHIIDRQRGREAERQMGTQWRRKWEGLGPRIITVKNFCPGTLTKEVGPLKGASINKVLRTFCVYRQGPKLGVSRCGPMMRGGGPQSLGRPVLKMRAVLGTAGPWLLNKISGEIKARPVEVEWLQDRLGSVVSCGGPSMCRGEQAKSTPCRGLGTPSPKLCI